MAAAVELAEVDLHSSEKTATEACAVPAADVQAEVEVSTAAVAHSLPVGPDGEPVTWIEKKGQAFENWMNEDWPHVPLFWEKEYTGPSPEELGWKGRLWHRTRGVVNKSLSGACRCASWTSRPPPPPPPPLPGSQGARDAAPHNGICDRGVTAVCSLPSLPPQAPSLWARSW